MSETLDNAPSATDAIVTLASSPNPLFRIRILREVTIGRETIPASCACVDRIWEIEKWNSLTRRYEHFVYRPTFEESRLTVVAQLARLQAEAKLARHLSFTRFAEEYSTDGVAAWRQAIADKLVEHTEAADVAGHEAVLLAAVEFLDDHGLLFRDPGTDSRAELPPRPAGIRLAPVQEQPC